MLYKDLCGCDKSVVSRENNTWQSDNNTQLPNDNTNRPSDKWPNWDKSCPNKDSDCSENGMMCPGNVTTQNELLNQIRETVFAIVDLNLFLDTHPNCKEALELFTSLAFTLEALKREYTSHYGPLKAVDSANDIPFEWVSEQYLWPWQRKKEE